MVKICSNTYSENTKYNQLFEKYPYSLSSFQKYSIEAIVEGHHVLVTAHTGSGKTLCAEFAIEYFVLELKKKVIYTSPIKALSNQKYYEFTKKFPNISFGILTGDIKLNPEADVVIMTTEILLNSLYSKNTNTNTNTNRTNINININININELNCVIFDEIHYINDADRGKIWEETIMLLPKHIQMVMLSATLDTPERFASWCEKQQPNSNKIVYLASTNERIVPLVHYSFITCGQGIFKILKDKQLELEVMKATNNLHLIQDAKGHFNEVEYQQVSKILKVFKDKNHYVKRQHVINNVVTYMFEHNMLPAICFILSKKMLEKIAKEVTVNLLEDDSKIGYIVRRECEQIIRKLPNYEEYLNLPEYLFIVSLFEKGIAIHHAGVMPVLREMIELLFAKGYIKLLFATETFAVGINMPTKTVLFTDLCKYNGTITRPFYSHEYTQMAGRAGRRGIDEIGYVIHLTNLFNEFDVLTVKNVMKNVPQKLISKFKISYNLIFNLIEMGIHKNEYIEYVQKSMIQDDINNTLHNYKLEASKLKKEIEEIKEKEEAEDKIKVFEEYLKLKDELMISSNKKRKQIEKTLKNMNILESELQLYINYKLKLKEQTKINELIEETQNMLSNNICVVLQILKEQSFIEEEIDDVKDDAKNDLKIETNNKYVLTKKGKIASCIKEPHCLVFGELIANGMLEKLTSKELVGVLSCFTNINVVEEKKFFKSTSMNKNVQELIERLDGLYQRQYDIEILNNINTGMDYNIQFDLTDYIMQWCDCNNELDCKLLLQDMLMNKDIYLGEFVKSILSISKMIGYFQIVCEYLNDINSLCMLQNIDVLILKYVATKSSLYV
jgi:superfamily II RNA helicase